MKVWFTVSDGLNVGSVMADSDNLSIIKTGVFNAFRIRAVRYLKGGDIIMVTLVPRGKEAYVSYTPGYQGVVPAEWCREGRTVMRFSNRGCVIRRE